MKLAPLTVFLGYQHDRLLEAVAVAAAAGRADGLHPAITQWPEIGPGNEPRHPALHGDLADVAVEQSAWPLHPRVVCTHSDTFVLRIRRRVAEGSLRPAAVALVWVHADGSQRPIPLNDRGTPEWWPDDVGREAANEFAALRRALQARPRSDAEVDPS